MNTAVWYERESRWNVIQSFATSRHAMSNRIKTRNANPKFTTRTLKIVRDVRKTPVSQLNTAKWSRHVTSDIISRLSIKLSMGFNMQHNKLLNDNKSIPQSVFTHNTKMGTVWLLKTNSIPFMVDLVYILVQNSKFSL